MIAVIVLAGGSSTRMGCPKLLLPVGGRPLVRLSVERILGAAPGGIDLVVVVAGAEATAIGRALDGLPVRLVDNRRHAEGQSTSLQAGLDVLPPVEATIVALGDQPLPDGGLLDRLVTTFRCAGRPIVVPRYRGGRGTPVLFGAEVFGELRRVTGDQGGREVIARDPSRVAEVVVDAPMPRDVDTWADYEALRTGLERSETGGG